MRRALAVLLAAAGLALLPSSAAHAALTTTGSGSTLTVTGDSGADTLVVTVDTGLLRHNIPPTGNLVSAVDWNSATAGVQSASSNGSYTLVVNLGDGDDTVFIDSQVDVASSQINGQGGQDRITAGSDNDLISGGPGDDVLSGRVGADTIAGGAGDDQIIWNNGDGNDVVDGDEDEDTLQVNGAPAAETYTIKPDASRSLLQRTAPSAFEIDFEAEFVEVRSGAGADQVTTQAGLTALPTIRGGDGDDVFNVRDGESSILYGGVGTDTATIDTDYQDRNFGIEKTNELEIGITVAKSAPVKRGKASLTLTCVTGGSSCGAEINLVTKKPVKLGAVTAKVVLGTLLLSDLKPGTGKRKVKLAKGYAKLAKKGRIKAVITISREGDVTLKRNITLTL